MRHKLKSWAEIFCNICWWWLGFFWGGGLFRDSIMWIILGLFFFFCFKVVTWFFRRNETTLQISITPSSLTLPSVSRFQGEKERKRRLFTPLSHSPIIPATTFIHHTEKKIESIHWPFRQWRKEILRALLDMKIYNKNQFLDSLCSLNDKAFIHSTIVFRKVILLHRPRQEHHILSDRDCRF